MGEVRPVEPGAHGSDPDCAPCRALRTALVRLLWERDYSDLTEPDVAAAAGVPAAEFPHHYPDLGACLEAAYCEWDDEISELFAGALEGEGHWTDRLGDAVEAVFTAIEREPGGLRLFEAAWAGPPSLQRRRANDRRRYAELLARQAPELPALHAEFILGALHRAAQEGIASPDRDIGRMRRRALELIQVLEPVPA